MLVFLLVRQLREVDGRELPAQDLDQEVAGTTSRLEELEFNSGERVRKHLRDEVEHRVDLTLMRVDLSQIPNSLTSLDLLPAVAG